MEVLKAIGQLFEGDDAVRVLVKLAEKERDVFAHAGEVLCTTGHLFKCKIR